jgi:hypothetical protein
MFGAFRFENMFSSKAHRFLNAMTGLFFIVLAGLLVVLAAQIQIHDGNYAAFYLGLGVWLECVYLAVHFGLEAMLITRARLAERISQVLAVLLMVPLGLIILILAVLFEQSIRTSVNYEPEVRITAWVFLPKTPSRLKSLKLAASVVNLRRP